MKIWSWKSAITLWVFSWLWISAFDVCLPVVMSFSASYTESQEEKETLAAQELEAKAEAAFAIRTARLEELRVLHYELLGIPL